jgi:hypothetical protein
MKTNLKKCILYLRSSPGVVKYHIHPEPSSVEQQESKTVYTFDLDISCANQITIHVDYRDPDAHLVVEKILVNNLEINDLNIISFLRTQSGEIRKNYGYIDSEGEFIIKLHTNPISLNYLNYLLSLTK